MLRTNALDMSMWAIGVVWRREQENNVNMLVVLADVLFDDILLCCKVIIIDQYIPGAELPKINTL